MKKKYLIMIVVAVIGGSIFLINGFKNPIDNRENNNNSISSTSLNEPSYSNEANSSDENLIKENNLLNDSKVDVKDRIEAKKVAENFVKAITIFNFEKPDGMAENAVKYVCNDKKKEIESLYIHLGKSEDVKKTILDSIDSEEVENNENNDYIYFRVSVKWSAIDKNNQKINGGDETYMTKLLKENGEYKVFEYWVD